MTTRATGDNQKQTELMSQLHPMKAAALRAHRPQAILLVVDHRPEALAVADRVLTLAHGRLVDDRPVRRG
jgi:ABC-type transport system involved in cytochrome bd biosynthesis fused ATPase/permease subunit